MKYIAWACVLIIVAGAGYYLYSSKTAGKASAPAEPSISWGFEDAGERDAIPYTKVSVAVNGVMHTVGEFQGSCSEVGASGGVDGTGLLAGELSAAQCWFAGGGDEIGVFAIESGGYEVMTGQLSEPTAESQGFRGDFKIRTDIKL